MASISKKNSKHSKNKNIIPVRGRGVHSSSKLKNFINHDIPNLFNLSEADASKLKAIFIKHPPERVRKSVYFEIGIQFDIDFEIDAKLIEATFDGLINESKDDEIIPNGLKYKLKMLYNNGKIDIFFVAIRMIDSINHNVIKYTAKNRKIDNCSVLTNHAITCYPCKMNEPCGAKNRFNSNPVIKNDGKMIYMDIQCNQNCHLTQGNFNDQLRYKLLVELITDEGNIRLAISDNTFVHNKAQLKKHQEEITVENNTCLNNKISSDPVNNRIPINFNQFEIPNIEDELKKIFTNAPSNDKKNIDELNHQINPNETSHTNSYSHTQNEVINNNQQEISTKENNTIFNQSFNINNQLENKNQHINYEKLSQNNIGISNNINTTSVSNNENKDDFINKNHTGVWDNQNIRSSQYNENEIINSKQKFINDQLNDLNMILLNVNQIINSVCSIKSENIYSSNINSIIPSTGQQKNMSDSLFLNNMNEKIDNSKQEIIPTSQYKSNSIYYNLINNDILQDPSLIGNTIYQPEKNVRHNHVDTCADTNSRTNDVLYNSCPTNYLCNQNTENEYYIPKMNNFDDNNQKINHVSSDIMKKDNSQNLISTYGVSSKNNTDSMPSDTILNEISNNQIINSISDCNQNNNCVSSNDSMNGSTYNKRLSDISSSNILNSISCNHQTNIENQSYNNTNSEYYTHHSNEVSNNTNKRENSQLIPNSNEVPYNHDNKNYSNIPNNNRGSYNTSKSGVDNKENEGIACRNKNEVVQYIENNGVGYNKNDLYPHDSNNKDINSNSISNRVSHILDINGNSNNEKTNNGSYNKSLNSFLISEICNNSPLENSVINCGLNNTNEVGISTNQNIISTQDNQAIYSLLNNHNGNMNRYNNNQTMNTVHINPNPSNILAYQCTNCGFANTVTNGFSYYINPIDESNKNMIGVTNDQRIDQNGFNNNHDIIQQTTNQSQNYYNNIYNNVGNGNNPIYLTLPPPCITNNNSGVGYQIIIINPANLINQNQYSTHTMMQ